MIVCIYQKPSYTLTPGAKFKGGERGPQTKLTVDFFEHGSHVLQIIMIQKPY